MSDIAVERYDWGEIHYSDASHRYWIHDGERVAVPSVTTALDILAKPQLLRWYEQMGIEGVKEALQGLNLINPGDKDLDWTKVVRDNHLGAEARRDAGATRGTKVHEALRLYASENQIPQLAAYRGEEENYVAGLQAWLVQARPEPIVVERMVASPKHKFAGRFDLLAEIEGKRLIVDLKTRKTPTPYVPDMLQLDGYMTACRECGLDVDWAAVLLIGADGVYRFVRMPTQAHLQFVTILEAWNIFKDVKAALKNG